MLTETLRYTLYLFGGIAYLVAIAWTSAEWLMLDAEELEKKRGSVLMLWFSATMFLLSLGGGFVWALIAG